MFKFAKINCISMCYSVLEQNQIQLTYLNVYYVFTWCH